MRYFKDRVEAGKILADQIESRYHHADCAIVALSDGGVMVGSQIALRLKAVLTLFLTAPIVLPRENDVFASVNQDGGLMYNSRYSKSEIDELLGEYRVFIEEQRLQGLHDINTVFGADGVMKRDLLRDRSVILVSDGLNGSFALDAAADFLKPVRVNKLIVATPLADVPAVDRMHILADEIYCPNVLPDYISTDHYYDAHDVPGHDDVIKIVQDTVAHWK
jgi:putative phosphoribosyl transferase